MSDSERQQAIEELIAVTYENMGLAVLNVNAFAPGVFKLGIIDENGPKEVLVMVLLQMQITV